MEAKTEYRNSQRIAFEKISELLVPRLNKLGIITADEAWKICRAFYPYGTIIKHFKTMMEAKQKNEEADNMGKGKWFIYRQTKKASIC